MMSAPTDWSAVITLYWTLIALCVLVLGWLVRIETRYRKEKRDQQEREE